MKESPYTLIVDLKAFWDNMTVSLAGSKPLKFIYSLATFCHSEPYKELVNCNALGAYMSRNSVRLLSLLTVNSCILF